MLSDRGEHGFTLVELMVTMTIMMLVTGALLGALESGTTAEGRASARIDAQQSARLVLDQFSKDVRNATAVSAASANEIDLVEPSGPVSWVFDPAGTQLTRYLGISPGWTAGVAATGLTGGAFDALASDGSSLVSAAGLTDADAAQCAGTITATVSVFQRPPATAFSESGSAPVRNQGDQRGCP